MAPRQKCHKPTRKSFPINKSAMPPFHGMEAVVELWATQREVETLRRGFLD